MEYVLWGTPAGETDALHEVVLTCTAFQDRVRVVQELATRDGFHSFRIQVLDGSAPNFARAVSR